MPRKSAVKKGGEKGGVALIPQPHGGALLPGGQKGQTPGPGRPASEVIARARGAFDERIPVLEEIADNPKAADADRIRAVDKLGKYGLSDVISRADVREALAETIQAIRGAVAPETADSLLAMIREFWKRL